MRLSKYDVAAGAQQEGALQRVDRAVDRPGRGEGAEIIALAIAAPRCLVSLRDSVVAGEQDIGELLSSRSSTLKRGFSCLIRLHSSSSASASVRVRRTPCSRSARSCARCGWCGRTGGYRRRRAGAGSWPCRHRARRPPRPACDRRRGRAAHVSNGRARPAGPAAAKRRPPRRPGSDRMRDSASRSSGSRSSGSMSSGSRSLGSMSDGSPSNARSGASSSGLSSSGLSWGGAFGGREGDGEETHGANLGVARGRRKAPPHRRQCEFDPDAGRSRHLQLAVVLTNNQP